MTHRNDGPTSSPRSNQSWRSPPDTDESSGTMTLREKELFSKIFQSILAKKPETSNPGENASNVWSESSADSDTHQSTAPQTAAKDFLAAYPPSLQREIQQAEIIVKTKEQRESTRRKAIEDRSDPNYQKVKERLNACATLQAVLDFVEVDLFGPFTRNEVSLEAVAAMTKRETTDLSNFCHAYPLLLRDVMSTLRLAYRNHAAALQIFRRAKELGTVSEVVGIDTAVYNEVLLAQFEGWNYVSPVLKILLDMELDGIEPDQYTVSVLKNIVAEILQQKGGSPSSSLIWSVARPTQLESLSRALHTMEKKLGLRVR